MLKEVYEQHAGPYKCNQDVERFNTAETIYSNYRYLFSDDNEFVIWFLKANPNVIDKMYKEAKYNESMRDANDHMKELLIDSLIESVSSAMESKARGKDSFFSFDREAFSHWVSDANSAELKRYLNKNFTGAKLAHFERVVDILNLQPN